jgi:hypothetical protein
VHEAVIASAAISGPLPIKIRSRTVIGVFSSSAYRSPANSKLFNEVTAVIRAQLRIIPVAASNELASGEWRVCYWSEGVRSCMERVAEGGKRGRG